MGAPGVPHSRIARSALGRPLWIPAYTFARPTIGVIPTVGMLRRPRRNNRMLSRRKCVFSFGRNTTGPPPGKKEKNLEPAVNLRSSRDWRHRQHGELRPPPSQEYHTAVQEMRRQPSGCAVRCPTNAIESVSTNTKGRACPVALTASPNPSGSNRIDHRTISSGTNREGSR